MTSKKIYSNKQFTKPKKPLAFPKEAQISKVQIQDGSQPSNSKIKSTKTLISTEQTQASEFKILIKQILSLI
jgi:hypothetical protein